MSPISVLSIVAFMSMMGFGLLIPLTPAFVLQFGLNKVQIGILGGMFPAMQFISSIILGNISDHIGRKKTIYVSFLIVTFSYVLLAFSNSFLLLLLSRAIGGFFSGALVAALAGASDLSTNETRMKYMGLIGMSFGLGFMFGPTIGGVLAGNDINNVNIMLVSSVSAILSLIAALLAFFVLPETRPLLPKSDQYEKKGLLSLIVDSLKDKITFLHFALNTLISTVFASIEVFVSVVSANEFQFSPLNTGIFWAMFSLILNFGRVLLLKPMGNYKGMSIGFFIIGAGILLYIPGFGIPLKGLFYVASGFIALMSGLALTIINSKMSLQGSPYTQGLIFGLNNSLGNLGRFSGPILLGIVWQTFHSITYVWVICSIISFLGSIISYRLIKLTHTD